MRITKKSKRSNEFEIQFQATEVEAESSRVSQRDS